MAVATLYHRRLLSARYHVLTALGVPPKTAARQSKGCNVFRNALLAAGGDPDAHPLLCIHVKGARRGKDAITLLGAIALDHKRR